MKNSKIILAGLAALACCCTVTSCNNEKADVIDTNVVTDTLGRKVEVSKDVKKVYCIGAGSLRLYSYVADINKLCAIEEIEQDKSKSPINQGAMIRPYQLAHQEEFNKIKTLGMGGPKAQKFSKEQIVEAEADVVFSMIATEASELDELQKATNTPIINLSYGNEKFLSEEPRSMINSLKTIGAVMGEEATKRADELIEYMKNIKVELQTYSNTIADAEKPKIYIGGLASWGGHAFYSSSTNYFPFETAGVKNFLEGLTHEDLGNINNINKEIIYNAEGSDGSTGPDKVILDASSLAQIANQYKQGLPETKLINDIPAVKAGEVYLQPTFRDYYTNIELGFVNAYHAAKIAYPEQTKDLDIVEKSKEIITKFNRKDVYEQMSKRLFGNPFQKIENLETWCKTTFSDKK